MIGKIMTGKSFRGCLLYCLNDKLKKQKEEVIFKNRAEIIMYNKCFGNEKELIQQFNDVRQLNPKLSKPVLHVTLSFAKDDKLDQNRLIEISEACAKDLVFENNQYVSIFHKDTEHPHMHIVANRIGFDKRTVSDSNNYQKTAAFCRKMELKYNLRQVLSPRRYLSKEQRLIPRNDERKAQLKLVIRRTLFQSKNYEEFEKKMQAQGYITIKGKGISFIDDKKVKIKGSEVGYSLATIERMLENLKLLQTREGVKQILSNKPLKPVENDIKEISEAKQKDILNNNSSLAENLSKTIDDLIKPEQIQEQVNPNLLTKKKQRKKKRGFRL
jgi:hypothetical protein